MGEENEKRTFRLWFYIVPIFILAAWPALRWLYKANYSELNLSKDEYTAFNSESGEIRKTAAPKTGKPDFDYGILGVRYKSKGDATADANAEAEEEAARRAEAKKQAEAAKQTAAAAAAGKNAARSGAASTALDGMKAKEQQSVGYTKGYLSYAMGKVINSPKAVGAILNNKNVISGFMARGTVKDATSSPEALAKYLKSGGPANFINNPLVKSAMGNPGVVSAVASSGLVNAMLETPAGKALMNDPQALGELVASNPELVGMIMSNPNTMSLLGNPDVAGVTGKFDTSAIKIK